MKKTLLVLPLLLLLTCLSAKAQTKSTADTLLCRYRVTLTDKKGTPYSLNHPEAFLSKKSIERRLRYGIKPDSLDLPINPAYIKQLRKQGVKIINQSKWNNTVVVETADSVLAKDLTSLNFVKDVKCVWRKPKYNRPINDEPDRKSMLNDANPIHTLAAYGKSYKQVEMIEADRLHSLGYKGNGMTIAILDGGFLNVDIIAGLKTVKILGTRNFVNPDKNVFEDTDHGTMVLSCIAANSPHKLVGTAPEASFYLIQTEDGRSEQLIEEDNYAAGIEYADSLGCDVVTASLGYNQFDHKEMNHKYYELDGQTPLISRSASLAASRGILAVGSAGNSGRDRWKKITPPADASNFITVGAVDADRLNTGFSSLGNTSDGRIKPDVMAIGEDAWVYDGRGRISTANGTSFACPIMCGGATCLVQAFPNVHPTEIIRAIQLSGDNAQHPDNIFGYGIPALSKAYEYLSKKQK